MKKIKLLLLILVFLVLSIQPSWARTVYYDTYGHWAQKDIDYASNTLKVFNGYGDFTFRPENNITRAEFITALARTAYKQNKMNEVYTSNMAYTDMSMKNWSYTFVSSMYEHLKTNQKYKFTDIFPGINFYPDKPITREESVALIAVFCKDSIYDNPIPFGDVSESNKYYGELKRLYNSKVITGYEDNTFKGNTNITRAEAAALIQRIDNDIKTSDESKYLTKLEFMPIKGERIYSFFGNYDFNTTDTNHRKFIKAKNTLEYLSFGGYIYPDATHLYDLNALDTMNNLKNSGYFNVAGTNFYLLTFGKYPDAQNNEFANEILYNIIARNDLKDSELMQLFTLVSKYSVEENLYLDALEKWYSQTTDNNAKANILFFRYAYYIKTNNPEMLRTIVYDDLKKSNDIPSLLNINWSLTPGSSVDFRNYGFGVYNYSLYKDMTLYKFMSQPNNTFNYSSKVVELVNMLLIEKIEKQNFSALNPYESIFQKYSINRLYVLHFIGENERAFVEGLNDYEILKTFGLYNTMKQTIDDTYTGILKKVK